MSVETILVVDDEEDILELIRYNLEREGYKIICAASGEEALKKSVSTPLDLILLDLMLPGIDGLNVARRLKNNKNNRNVPIIMLTAKGDEADIIIGLEMGADDYITKPFSPKILIARIRAAIRKQKKKLYMDTFEISIHDLVINFGMRSVKIKGEPVKLRYSEFQILSSLVKRQGWVFTRTQIVNLVHGNNYPVTDRSIDVQIVGLRKKLGLFGKYIETVRGVGYRFRETE